MELFNLMITLILMMLALQFGESWMIIAVVALTILTMRDFKATVVLLVATGVLYFARGSLEPYWPFLFFGLVILALLMGAGGGAGGGAQQGEYYSPDMYSGLMGGGGGGGF
ncbi:MAG: hypothetical protein QGI60_03995 [archaeon]|nr:hypothetical protein [archaeon]